MNAPVRLGRCECRAADCPACGGQSGYHWADAVRLVTVPLHEARPDLCADSANVTVERAYCAACADFAEKGTK